MHLLLLDLGLDLPARHALLARIREGFAAEHHVRYIHSAARVQARISS